MKKFLLLIIFFTLSVSAKEYYSEYGPFSTWSFDEVISSDTIYVEKDKWYKYYYEDIKGKFFIEGENTLAYPYIDRNNSYYDSFSDYSENIPLNVKNRVVEIKEKYVYLIPNNVRYIKINNIKGGYGSLRIPEISITDMNGSKINYKYRCSGCNDNFGTHINNNVIMENMSYIQNGGELIIDLQKNYTYDSIKVNISLFDVTNDYKTFNIIFMDDKNEVMKYEFNSNFSLVYLDDIKTFSYDYSNLKEVNLWQEKKYESDTVIPHTKVVSKKNYYRYKDLYYFYYDIKKVYSEYLATSSSKYPIKSDDYKYVYRYKKRDKVVIPDTIVITSMENSIYDYIESEVPVYIKGDINMYENGNYEVDIIMPFEVVRKNVTVDIEENDIRKELDGLKNEHQKLKEDYDILENNYNVLLEESKNNINEKNIEYANLYNGMIEDINNYKMEINKLNILVADYQNKIDEMDKSKYKDIKTLENEIINLRLQSKEEVIEKPNYSYIYIGIILILLVLLCIKKSKKN